MISEQNNWIRSEDQLPQLINGRMKAVLGLTGKKRMIVYYFPDRFKTIEFEDWDDYSAEEFPYTEEDEKGGCVWLKAGWYEEVVCERCDTYSWEPISVTHWQPLPQIPHNDPF